MLKHAHANQQGDDINPFNPFEKPHDKYEAKAMTCFFLDTEEVSEEPECSFLTWAVGVNILTIQ